MVFRPVRQLLRRFVVHEAEHVIVGRIDAGSTSTRGAEDWAECTVVESARELAATAVEIPPGLSPDWLCRAFRPGHILILVRRPCGPDGQRQVVGYRLCQRGVLKSSLGMEARIPDDFLFIHRALVLPEHRGQRVAQALRECAYRFAARHNIAWTCGVVSVSNAASLTAHLRPGTGTSVVATIHRLSLFGGRLVWRTGRRRIAKTLDRLAMGEKTLVEADVSFDQPRR